MFPQRFLAACCLEVYLRYGRATYAESVRCHGTFTFKGFTFAVHDPVKADRKKFEMVVSEATTGWSFYKMQSFGSQDDAIHQALAHWRALKLTPSLFRERLEELHRLGMTANQLDNPFNSIPVWLYSNVFGMLA